VIPPEIERRARWVLDTLGARDVRPAEVGFQADAWDAVSRGERPEGDELAEAFFHLARLEEARGPRDRHGRFPGTASCLDLLDPPLERLRERLGVEPPRWRGARFAVALTHDVDVPWRWTRAGIRGGASRLKAQVLAGSAGGALQEARALSAVPVHRLRGTDPNWRFAEILALEREHGARSTFFVMAGHRHRADGPAPDVYARRRPALVELLADGGGEPALHGSYTSAEDPAVLAEEKAALEQLAGPVCGQRYHYLRVDPHRNLAPLADAGLAYDSTLGFADAVGFRAGIVQPFRPWSLALDRPLELVEIPLALMDVTLSEERYLGLSARESRRRIEQLLDLASERGGGFAVLWHTDRFDHPTARGWDRLYVWFLEAVSDRGGICLTAGELADEAESWLP
jgi:peptidoglycan/xylan/chitin deacetylase (PgdA/CDA1 family)